MRKKKVHAIAIKSFALLVVLGAAVSVRRIMRWHRMPRHLIRTWPRSTNTS